MLSAARVFRKIPSSSYRRIGSRLVSSSISAHGSKIYEQRRPDEHVWRPFKALAQVKPQDDDTEPYMCLLLNLNKKHYMEFHDVKYIWNNSDYRIAIDGAANCLCCLSMEDTIDLVSGDFDSIDGNLLNNLRNSTKSITQVIETPEQDETDFTKGLQVASAKRPDIHICVALFKDDGSRLDHLFGIINTLHMINNIAIILVNLNESVSWILRPGRHTIHKRRGDEICSLVPFKGATRVTSHGLVWDMNNSLIQFGGLVSTSNRCRDNTERLIIETDRPILLTMNLKFPL